MLSSVFSQKLLDEFIEVFNYQGRRLVSQWVDKHGPFIPSKDISLNSLESICRELFANHSVKAVLRGYPSKIRIGF